MKLMVFVIEQKPPIIRWWKPIIAAMVIILCEESDQFLQGYCLSGIVYNVSAIGQDVEDKSQIYKGL